ncbi:hypothetical protein C6P45_002379 [Maudiozyma exigua]|uniref:Homeobox domain-containing protein n=1 Tax=Maudiozyma exigua TaxID=34358 RepID=A0A9P6WEX0_MAUEX|nr:hypothetical protein C6P45_002379 [Kazachstania exigua]
MTFQNKQVKVQLPPIKNLFDSLDINEMEKTPPMRNVNTTESSPSGFMMDNLAAAKTLNAIPVTLTKVDQRQLSPIFNSYQTNVPQVQQYTNLSASNSPLNYNEYSNYYNYIRHPNVSTHASAQQPNMIPYQNHYQSQRYTANIIGSHNNEIPRTATTNMHNGPVMMIPQHLNQHQQYKTVEPMNKSKKTHRMTGKRSNLPKETVKILNHWLVNHLNNPYPTPAEKNELLKQTGLTKIQLSNWFINVRRRKVFTDNFDKKLVNNKSTSVETSPSPTHSV